MNCCNDYGQCTRGHGCPAGPKDEPNAYKNNFDHLGDPVTYVTPITLPDLLIVVLAVLCIVGLVVGIR